MRGVMDMVIEKARARNRESRKGRVSLKKGKVTMLIFNDISTAGQKKKVLGAVLENGEKLHGSLTILALGAWTPSLLDLRGRAEATAQVIAYISLSHREAARLSKMPVLLNLSTGMFVIPPVRDPVGGGWILKVANHSYGYTNPTRVSPQGEEIIASLPASTFAPIPPRAESALRNFLRATIPWLGERAFCGTRICWYTDTPSGDFLIDYHPGYEGCFLATGGSGHGFKFLPVLGERIVEGLEGGLAEEFRGLWRWREGVGVPFNGTDDGSRRGEKGLVLGDELRRGREGKSKL
ncbi:hypothetical protein N7G274_001761 [Stereocaulon virgatum]|uniref:FAD dependent oxidoreductase domain-containing protein n=1 Tax=Stereocaulon virgatum TaxID=373712 RepID=A0ABR4ALC2_9LECA